MCDLELVSSTKLEHLGLFVEIYTELYLLPISHNKLLLLDLRVNLRNDALIVCCQKDCGCVSLEYPLYISELREVLHLSSGKCPLSPIRGPLNIAYDNLIVPDSPYTNDANEAGEEEKELEPKNGPVIPDSKEEEEETEKRKRETKKRKNIGSCFIIKKKHTKVRVVVHKHYHYHIHVFENKD